MRSLQYSFMHAQFANGQQIKKVLSQWIDFFFIIPLRYQYTAGRVVLPNGTTET